MQLKSLRDCSFEIRRGVGVGGGEGGWTVPDLLCVKYYGPHSNSCVFFLTPFVYSSKKSWPP